VKEYRCVNNAQNLTIFKEFSTLDSLRMMGFIWEVYEL